MPRKKATKKVSSSKSSDSNITDLSETSESTKSDMLLSENSDTSKKSTSTTSSKKKTKAKSKAKAKPKTKAKAKPKKKKSKKEDDYVVIKADPEELKKSLSYNVKEIESLTKTEYDKQFSILREKYVKLCKDFSDFQIQLKKKDSEREDVLKEIRLLQKNNSNLVVNDLNLDNISDEKKITTVDKKSSKGKGKGKSKSDVNLIDRYKKKVNKNIILKPLRDTDMETDDSESEELSDSESSDSCADSS